MWKTTPMLPPIAGQLTDGAGGTPVRGQVEDAQPLALRALGEERHAAIAGVTLFEAGIGR